MCDRPVMYSVPNPVMSTALARGEHPVVIVGKQRLTASELRSLVAERAALLRRQQISATDRVAIFGAPSLEWIVTFHAVGWIGAVAVPMPPEATESERGKLLEMIAPTKVLRLPFASAAKRALPSTLPEERFWPLDETRAIVFTSGTSGTPKAVTIDTAQLLFSAFGSAVRLGHDLHDKWLACLPLHHIGGLSILTRCALMGTCIVLHERFDAQRVAAELDAGDVTLVSLVPTMLDRVLDVRADRPFPSSLRAILVGGASLSQTTLDRCRALGAPIAITWGMSEAASQVTTRITGDLSTDGGCGAPLPFVRVTEIENRLLVHGPVVCDGQIATNDLGHVDVQGHVHVTGRVDDIIISGGEKIAPQEVETLLASHSSIAEVAVVARKDERWGQRPIAFAVPTDFRNTLDSEQLIGWCRGQITAHKIPDALIWCDALPRTATGKIARGELRYRANEVEMGATIARPKVFAERALLSGLTAASPDVTAPNVTQHAEQLEQLHAWLSSDLDALEDKIATVAASKKDLAEQAASHLLAQSGKRIRPLCVFIAARMGCIETSERMREQLCDLAMACEIVHAATLLHDDVIDAGTERRGAVAARTLFGNTASILAGDYLLMAALTRVRGCGVDALLGELLDTVNQMIAAEALQLAQQRRFDPRPELYLRIVEGKTASLFRWALRAGATLGGMSAPAIDSLGVLGMHLGVAFQLVDDLLDFTGDPKSVGKDTLADLHEGKLTWPLLFAARRDQTLAADLRRFAEFESNDSGSDQIAESLVERVLATGALAGTRGEAITHAEKANSVLGLLPEGRATAALRQVVEFCIDRVN